MDMCTKQDTFGVREAIEFYRLSHNSSFGEFRLCFCNYENHRLMVSANCSIIHVLSAFFPRDDGKKRVLPKAAILQ